MSISMERDVLRATCLTYVCPCTVNCSIFSTLYPSMEVGGKIPEAVKCVEDPLVAAEAFRSYVRAILEEKMKYVEESSNEMATFPRLLRSMQPGKFVEADILDLYAFVLEVRIGVLVPDVPVNTARKEKHVLYADLYGGEIMYGL